MGEKRARIGVIGTGWWATFAHLPSLSSYPYADLIGVADPNLEKAQQAAERFGVPAAFADVDELLALKPDGVVIATPHNTHYELARAALLAGCDVMIEKPMTVEPAHARELVDIAKKNGCNLHVGYPYPYTRHNQLLRQMIQNGDLGKLLYITSLFATAPYQLYLGNTDYAGEPDGGAMWGPGKDTYSDPTRGGGQMLTQVTHSASLVFFLTGQRPKEVHAFTSNYNTQVDVWEAVSFRTETGVCASIGSVGTVPLTQKTVEEYRIFGSKGFALLDTTNGTLSIFFEDGSKREETPLTAEEQYPRFQTSRQLVDVILERGPVVSSGELGLLTVEFLAAALQSAREGRVIAMPNGVE